MADPVAAQQLARTLQRRPDQVPSGAENMARVAALEHVTYVMAAIGLLPVAGALAAARHAACCWRTRKPW
ncbi:MAG: hypothetical protein R3F42_02705 [Pseudomonadota bacterium]